MGMSYVWYVCLSLFSVYLSLPLSLSFFSPYSLPLLRAPTCSRPFTHSYSLSHAPYTGMHRCLPGARTAHHPSGLPDATEAHAGGLLSLVVKMLDYVNDKARPCVALMTSLSLNNSILPLIKESATLPLLRTDRTPREAGREGGRGGWRCGQSRMLSL